MAIVFISPRKKQMMFLASIAGFFVVIVFIIGLVVFLAKPNKVSEQEAFKKPNISINLSVLDSAELSGLVSIDPMQYDFIYQATMENGKPASGKISALSAEDAIAKLKEQKLTVTKIEKEAPGRDNPFGVYYQQVINPKK